MWMIYLGAETFSNVKTTSGGRPSGVAALPRRMTVSPLSTLLTLATPWLGRIGRRGAAGGTEVMVIWLVWSVISFLVNALFCDLPFFLDILKPDKGQVGRTVWAGHRWPFENGNSLHKNALASFAQLYLYCPRGKVTFHWKSSRKGCDWQTVSCWDTVRCRVECKGTGVLYKLRNPKILVSQVMNHECLTGSKTEYN